MLRYIFVIENVINMNLNIKILVQFYRQILLQFGYGSVTVINTNRLMRLIIWVLEASSTKMGHICTGWFCVKLNLFPYFTKNVWIILNELPSLFSHLTFYLNKLKLKLGRARCRDKLCLIRKTFVFFR